MTGDPCGLRGLPPADSTAATFQLISLTPDLVCRQKSRALHKQSSEPHGQEMLNAGAAVHDLCAFSIMSAGINCGPCFGPPYLLTRSKDTQGWVSFQALGWEELTCSC